MNRIFKGALAIALCASITVLSARHAQADGAVSATQLESFVGASDGDFLGLGNGSIYNGSALQTSFTATANETVSFQYNFLTNEPMSSPLSLVNDFAFVNWSTPGSLTDFSDVASGTFIPGVGGYAAQTGYQTYSFMVSSTGTFTLNIGVVNAIDGLNDSALLVDNLQIGGTPTTNGNFATGDYTGFLTAGNAQVVTSSFGVTPPSGTYQALLSTSVPEPSSVVLLGLAVVSGAAFAHRRRTRHRLVRGS